MMPGQYCPRTPAPSSSGPRRVAIVTFCHNSACNGFFEPSVCNLARYAGRHGYTLIVENHAGCQRGFRDSGSDTPRNAKWCKVVVLEKHLHSFDWLIWVDIDTLIVDHSRSLEDVFRLQAGEEGAFDLFTAGDWNGMNTGVLAMRATSWSSQLLGSLWAAGDPATHPWTKASWRCNNSPKCWQEQYPLPVQ